MSWNIMSWAIITGHVSGYSDSNFIDILSGYLNSNPWVIEKIISQNQEILQLQNSNISFWYSHIQSVLWRLAVIGIVLFLASYWYIRKQARQVIYEINKESEELKGKYDELSTITKADIDYIKENNQFDYLLNKWLILKMNQRFEDALDNYDNMLSLQFINTDLDRKYSVYKEIADTHYLIWEKSPINYENAANYFNAIEALRNAREIYNKEDDDAFMNSLQDKYDYLISLVPSEEQF